MKNHVREYEIGKCSLWANIAEFRLVLGVDLHSQAYCNENYNENAVLTGTNQM